MTNLQQKEPPQGNAMASSLSTVTPVNLPVDNVLARLEAVKRTGDRWMARCPAHQDLTPSLSVKEVENHTVLLKCFAGCAFSDIVRALGLNEADLFVRSNQQPFSNPKKKDSEQPSVPATLEGLAAAKGFAVDYLTSLGVGPNPNGGGLQISYLREDYTPCPRQRIRLYLTGRKKYVWDHNKGDIEAYGQWLLPMARQVKYLFLVEGETDCWTLWLHRFPALGIPGASLAKTLQPQFLTGIEALYIVQEPGKGGKQFVAGMANRIVELGWKGDFRVIRMPL